VDGEGLDFDDGYGESYGRAPNSDKLTSEPFLAVWVPELRGSSLIDLGRSSLQVYFTLAMAHATTARTLKDRRATTSSGLRGNWKRGECQHSGLHVQIRRARTCVCCSPLS
jgi:hypothetical protein